MISLIRSLWLGKPSVRACKYCRWGFSSGKKAQEVSECAKTPHHCIYRHHISLVGHLGGLFIGSAGTDLLWVGEVFMCILVHNVGVC